MIITNTEQVANYQITQSLGLVTGNVVPSANVTYDLGTDTARWKDLYLSGNTINLGTTAISVTSDNEIDFSSNKFSYVIADLPYTDAKGRTDNELDKALLEVHSGATDEKSNEIWGFSSFFREKKK